MKRQSYKKLFNVAITATLVAGAVVAVAPPAGAAISFKDVKETNAHYENIMNLAERGIIRGYEDGTFRPGNSIKRGNAAHIIAEIIGLDTTNVKNPNFKDISTKNSNYGAIAALANAGIINGFEDGTYRANDMLTRGQMSKIIAKAFKLTPTGETVPFTDVERSQYKSHIIALYENSITTGVTPTFFDTKSFVTRGQLSSFVVRAEKVVKPEPTPTPTPTPEPSPTPNPTPTPEPGIPKPVPTPTVEQTAFINTLEEKLESVTIPNANIDVNGTVVTITSNPSISKGELVGVRESVVGSFLGIGTTVLLNSVTINGTPYSTPEELANETVIAMDIASVLGINSTEAAAILGLDANGSIWTALEKDTYSGTIYLNFKDNNLTVPVTITLTEKAQ